MKSFRFFAFPSIYEFSNHLGTESRKTRHPQNLASIFLDVNIYSIGKFFEMYRLFWWMAI